MSTRSAATDPASLANGGGRPVRVCIASIMYHPVYAGPAVRFKRYIPRLRARGADFSVLTATPDIVTGAASGLQNCWSKLPNGTLLPEEIIDGIPVQRVRVPNESGLHRRVMFARAGANYLRRITERPDVVQIFSAWIPELPILFRARRLGIPVVATWTMMPRLPRNPFKRAIFRGLTRWSSRLVSCFVVSSDVMLAAVRKQGIFTRIETIPHGVDTERFRPPVSVHERVTVRTKLGLPVDATILLFVGPVTPRKRVDLLVDAWSRLAAAHPDLHLAVVGPRLDASQPALAAFRRQLDVLATRAGARHRLHFTGIVDNVEEFMRAADIFVFTSAREGMPNVVPEAMASGLPVVTTPFDGLPREFGAPGNEFVLTDFDPDSIAGEVSRLLATAGRREELGIRARAWVKAHLNIDRTIDQYSELYRELARTGHEHAPIEDQNRAYRGRGHGQ
jgi:glycosyltransferase involved in cell wall biosynthesis